MNKIVFDLLVRSREGVMYQGQADSITSYNDKGKFDVLPHHANFISLIQKNLTIRTADGKVKEIPVDNALLRARMNNVEVYLGVQGMRNADLVSADEIKVEDKKLVNLE